jgi:hypothetical protein
VYFCRLSERDGKRRVDWVDGEKSYLLFKERERERERERIEERG